MEKDGPSTRTSFSIYGPNTYIERVAPISFAQARVYFLSQFLEDCTSLNVTLSNRVRGPLRVSQLIHAFQKVALRHEALRTCFFLDEETSEPMQGILNAPTFQLECRQVRNEGEVFEEIELFKRHRYDLETGEIVKATLLSLEPESHFLIFGHHHLVLDGVSRQNILHDLERAYRSQNLQPVYQYADFSNMQRALVESGLPEELSFWRSEFAELPPVLPLLPNAKVQSRQESMEPRSTVLKFTLNADLANQVKIVSRRLKVTSFQLHLSLLQLLLFKLVGERDLCIGVMDANRTNDLTESVGFFVNLLPVRFRIQESDTFEHLVTQTRQKALQALKHSQMPFDVLLGNLSVPRSSAHSPLFQVAVNYRMGTFRRASFGDCEMEFSSMDDASTTFDLIVDIEDRGDGVCCMAFVGQEYLYPVDALRTLANQYADLLNFVSRQPTLELNEYTISRSGENGIAELVGSPASTPAKPQPLRSQSALVMTKSGTWEPLNTVPVLELAPDSVLIKVETTALNPIDWKLPEFSLSPGSVGGSDFCGTVTGIGSDSLPKSLLVGDRVCGWVFGSNPQRPGNGAFAEYVTAFSDLVMKVPSWMSSEEACTLALASATAGQALYRSLQLPLPTAPAESPFYVLVNGGSTATGTMAIQLLNL